MEMRTSRRHRLIGIAASLLIPLFGCRAPTPRAVERSTLRRENPVPPGSPVGIIAMKTRPEDYLGVLARRDHYRFLVAGHVYGRHKPMRPGLFAPFADEIAHNPAMRDVAFAIFTGDIVGRCNKRFYGVLNQQLAAWGRPVFVAPGNHDSRDHPKIGDVFKWYFGRRDQMFMIGRDAFVIADSVMGGGNLTPRDVEHIDAMLRRRPRSLFIFVHHLVWIDRAKADADNALARTVNGLGAGYATRGNFDEVVLPRLLGARIPVFLIAGDVGATSHVIEHHEMRGKNVHLMASGMGEHPNIGTYIIVDISPASIRFEIHHLGDPSPLLPDMHIDFED